jgi:hypothetical protein
MSNARGKTVDTTYLSLEAAERRGFIHRDYIAHCLRWTHVVKRLAERQQWRTCRLLDIGCGRELPLAKLLYSSRYIIEKYHGVDVGPINDDAFETVAKSGKFDISVWERTDLLELETADLGGRVSHATMFEVAEHVEPTHLINILSHIQNFLLAIDGTLWLSTPCWNGQDTAANHVNEIRFHALARLFLDCGWSIRGVWGTFASIRDYVHQLSSEEQYLFDKLRDYYDTNYLSTIFAPLYPEYSRNALWELSPRPHASNVSFEIKDWKHIEQPWGSSEQWEDLANRSASYNGFKTK